MAISFKHDSVEQDIDDHVQQLRQLLGAAPLGSNHRKNYDQFGQRRVFTDMDKDFSKVTGLETYPNLQIEAENGYEQSQRQLAEHSFSQSYLLRILEALQVVLNSEALLMQLSSLGLKWGDFPEIDQRFIQIVQDMYSSMESVRSIRFEGMRAFDFPEFSDHETRHNGICPISPGLNEVKKVRGEHILPRHVTWNQHPHAAVDSSRSTRATHGHLAAPGMPFGQWTAAPTTFKHSGDEGIDHYVPDKIFNFETRETFGSSVSHTLPPMSREPSEDDAEAIFIRGMSSLLPSFF